MKQKSWVIWVDFYSRLIKLFCRLCTAIYCIAWGDGCGPYYVDTTLYESIVKTSVLAFLEHVRGAEGAWDQLVEDPGVVEWETAL